MGKYEFGSCGAFSESAGCQRGNDVGSFGGRLDSEKSLPREAIVEMAWVSGTASGGSEVAVMEVFAVFEPGPGIWLDRNGLYQGGCEVRRVRKRYTRRFLRSLQEESGQFGLGDYRELRERPPDVSFPVEVLGRIGSYNPHTTLSHQTAQNLAHRTHTFGSGRAVLFRPRTWLGVPVQGRNRETGRDFGVDDGRVACGDVVQPVDGVSQKKQTRTEFLPETLRGDMVQCRIGQLLGRHFRLARW